jgi:di/tricarboxylate transporter
MTIEIGYLLALIVVALFLFATEILSIDVVGLGLLLALTIPGILPPDRALAGFGSETIFVLIGLFVLTAGITRTGVVERIGLRLASFGSDRPQLLMRLLVSAATALSAFVSNTVTTAMLLPLSVASAKRAEISVSKMLMPLAYASILAGSITVIATSTNLVISGELPSYGLDRIGFFELAPVGIGLTLVGLLYLLFIAPSLIPDRFKSNRLATFGIRRFISEIVVPEGSKLVGQKLGESKLGETLNVTVLGVKRGDTRELSPRSNVVLEEGDVLLISGEAEDILAVKDLMGIDIHTGFKAADPDLESDDVRMVEAMVMPDSRWIRRSPRGAEFRTQTGLTVLAIHSPGSDQDLPRHLSRTRLKAGDVLLLQGRVDDIGKLNPRQLLNLEDVSGHHPRSRKGPIAAAIFIASLAVGGFGVLPMSIAFLAGAGALILSGTLDPEEAYRAVDWRLLVLIGCMMAFGVAMKDTGTSSYLADLVVEHVSPHGELAVLAAFFVLTAFLTQPMSNQAAALIVLPVAIESGMNLGIDPRPLVMVVTFAASCSFLTPLEPACILVYGPGRYRFFDFFKVGLPLTIVVFVFCMLLIPLIWPLHPIG